MKPKMPTSPKLEALEELAKAMSALKLDKLKGYKKTKAEDPMADAEEEAPVLEADAEEDPELDSEEVPEEDGDKPKSFSQVLEAVAKSKQKKH